MFRSLTSLGLRAMWYVLICGLERLSAWTGGAMRRIAFTLFVWLCSTVLPHAQEAQVKLPVIGWLSDVRDYIGRRHLQSS